MYITRLWGIGLLLLPIVYHKLEKRPSNADAHKKFPGEGGTKKGVAGRRNIRYNRETTKKAVEHVELLKQRIRQDGGGIITLLQAISYQRDQYRELSPEWLNRELNRIPKQP